MNYSDFLCKQAAAWMIERGWRLKLGKRGAFTQSLFEHTMVELNALLSLVPILERSVHYNLTEREKQSLVVGTIAHDVGKETDEWQAYVQESGSKKGVSHIIPELTERIVPELVAFLGFPEEIVKDSVTFVNLHMTGARTPARVMTVLTGEAHLSGRWATLARIVDSVDNLCSAPGLFAALQTLNYRSVFREHLRISYHLVQMRGVSTTLLHRAAMDAYSQTGWVPLLSYHNGTIYIASSTSATKEPAVELIKENLTENISNIVDADSVNLVVGDDPTATFIPKPDLFDYRELESYLQTATRRIKVGSFLRKSEAERTKRVLDYWRKAEKPGSPTGEDIKEHTQRIDRAQPEMLAFKLFKNAMAKKLLTKKGLFLDPREVAELKERHKEAIERGKSEEKEQKRLERELQKLERKAWADIEEAIRKEYDAVFGEGAYEKLAATSTLMPVREMAHVIDRFWELPGSRFGLSVERVGLAPNEERKRVLIERLTGIGQAIYDTLPEDKRPQRSSAAQISKVFINDLVHPTYKADIGKVAVAQMEAYRQAKTHAKTDSTEPHLCPICNQAFNQGVVAKADFVVNPESHTNRAVSHGKFGYIVICEICKFERFLQQLLLGDKVAQVIVLFPRMNIGLWSGKQLKNKIISFGEHARSLMSNASDNPNQGISLALTQLIARKLNAGGDWDKLRQAMGGDLDDNGLVNLVTYETAPDKQKQRRSELEKKLREEYKFDKGEEAIDELNGEWETNFTTWDEVVEAVIAGKVQNTVVEQLRVEIYRLHPQLNVVCETPHMILVPLTKDFSVGEESEANAALRELFISLLLGMTLDCSVATVASGDPITFEGGEGVARVPSVPAVRDLVGDEWVGLKETPKWLRAIGAASLLASATAYSERANLYQILSAPTPGHILRRIELKQKDGRVNFEQVKLIDSIKEVLFCAQGDLR